MRDFFFLALFLLAAPVQLTEDGLWQERAVFMIDAVDRMRHVHMEEQRIEEEEEEEDEAARKRRLANEAQFRPLIPHPLDWLPNKVSPNVRFVVSAQSHSEAHRSLVSRGWNVITVSGLDVESRERILMQWTKARGLTVSSSVQKRVLQRGQAQNPFFLTQVCVRACLRACSSSLCMRASLLVLRRDC